MVKRRNRSIADDTQLVRGDKFSDNHALVRLRAELTESRQTVRRVSDENSQLAQQLVNSQAFERHVSAKARALEVATLSLQQEQHNLQSKLTHAVNDLRTVTLKLASTTSALATARKDLAIASTEREAGAREVNVSSSLCTILSCLTSSCSLQTHSRTCGRALQWGLTLCVESTYQWPSTT